MRLQSCILEFIVDHIQFIRPCKLMVTKHIDMYFMVPSCYSEGLLFRKIMRVTFPEKTKQKQKTNKQTDKKKTYKPILS